MIPAERKELFCGNAAACRLWVDAHTKPDRLEIVRNDRPGPECSVYYKRKPTDPTVRNPIRRLTRATVRVQGVTRDRNRPLWVALEPGDVISFCPKGTRQRVAVPILSLYNHARFIAARAIALALERQRARKARKQTRKQ